MKQQPHAAALLSVATPLLLPLAAGAQGTAADYARAEGLTKRVEGKVTRASVFPHWIGDKGRFWYKNSLASGRSEYIFVDPDVPARRPAFDHARLATALSTALGKRVTADRLPLDGLALDPDAGRFRVQVGDRAFDVDPATYALTPSADPVGTAEPQHPRTVRRSRDGGEDTSLSFWNRTDAPISLFWVDGGGDRHAYGTVAAGARRSLHTYSGHAWLVERADGTPLVGFIARDEPALALVDGSTPPAPPPPANPSRSPDGKWRVVVHDHNLFLRGEDGPETRITEDGTAEDRYGGFVWWAPDSKRFVVLKTVAAEEHKVHFVESSPADRLQPKLHTIDYLKPGDRVARPRPRLFEVGESGVVRAIPVEEALFGNPWSLDDLEWAPDGKGFSFLYNERGHQILRVLHVDAATGAVRPVIEEKSPTFIDYSSKTFLHQLPETHEAVWMSERDGWNHLYLYDTATGAVKNAITQGPWVVRGVERVDAQKRQVWFRAMGMHPGEDPYYIQYCRVNFDGTGLTLLTPGDGTHTTTFSPDGRFLVDSFSRVDLPPMTQLRRTDDGAKVLDLERGDASALLQTGWRLPERFVAKGRDGKTDIYGVIWRPSNFNPAAKYPVLEEIYAGPHSAHVPKAFGASYGAHQMAELGFVVVRIDGMGTNWRSRAFHDVCWKNLVDAGFPDRIAWIKAAAKKHPEMDLTRVGIYGTSAGGQNALGGLLTHPEFYKAGVADCGCHDNRMDKIWWNEQWMGWPVGPEYAANSNVTLAPKLRGKLLLMVGEMDTNVDPASTMQVVNALIKADRDFELLVMPGIGHGAAGTPYGRRRLRDFFVRHLLHKEPRAAAVATAAPAKAPARRKK